MASFVPIFILMFQSSFCKSDDQLTRAKPLTHGDTLISKSGYFALGFFSPASSNKNLYLDIWYHNISGSRTVVWIANRDNPITTSSSAMLTITNSSRMILSDSNGGTLWVTKSNITAEGAGAYAVLLDSGNFVLRLPNGADIWQSFDHPTDTVLPTMKFLQSYKDRAVGRLVAWKGPHDPSSGDFSVSGDPASPALQNFIWHGIQPYYRGNVLNGMSVSGGTYRSNISSIIYHTNINQGDEFYVMFTVSDGLPFTRATLDSTGMRKYLAWNNHLSSWTVLAGSPKADCDLYASCGPFGYCDFSGITPTCRCLDGFEPDGLNFSRGCRRTEGLECGKQSHFVTLPGMKVPDKFLHIKNRSFDECAAECSGNCSCMAYAYANLSTAGAEADPSRCLVWTGELIDTAKSRGPGENLYLRLASSSVTQTRKKIVMLTWAERPPGQENPPCSLRKKEKRGSPCDGSK